jgi:hypothetical protein
LGVLFHDESGWTTAVAVTVVAGDVLTMERWTICPAAISVVPEIVGVGSFVGSGVPPAIVTTGSTVSTVRFCEAVPVFPAPSTTDAVIG